MIGCGSIGFIVYLLQGYLVQSKTNKFFHQILFSALMKWNASLYDQQHDFVSKYGEDVIALLNPQPGENILDLGCGTGDLAALIKNSGANVRGLDSSEEMIATARKKYPDIPFDQQSADQFSYDRPFDAVFSNATLHWVLNKEKAVHCIYDCLKPGGRLVAEFGGKGNVASIVNALKQALTKRGFHDRAAKTIWYFPSLSAYTTLLEENGFRVRFAAHFDRETELKDEQGIKNWLRQFGRAYLEGLDADIVNDLLTDVEEQVRPANFREGKWYADYKRLRVMAVRTA